MGVLIYILRTQQQCNISTNSTKFLELNANIYLRKVIRIIYIVPNSANGLIEKKSGIILKLIVPISFYLKLWCMIILIIYVDKPFQWRSKGMVMVNCAYAKGVNFKEVHDFAKVIYLSYNQIEIFLL
jgi:hypothetical protein